MLADLARNVVSARRLRAAPAAVIYRLFSDAAKSGRPQLSYLAPWHPAYWLEATQPSPLHARSRCRLNNTLRCSISTAGCHLSSMHARCPDVAMPACTTWSSRAWQPPFPARNPISRVRRCHVRSPTPGRSQPLMSLPLVGSIASSQEALAA